jgi:serine protease Do
MLYELPKLEKSNFSFSELGKKISLKAKPKNLYAVVLTLGFFLAVFSGFVGGALTVGYLFSGKEIRLPGFTLRLPQSADRNGNLPTTLGENNLPRDSQITSQEDAVINAVKKASPSVVSIIISKDLPVMETYYYDPFEGFFGNDLNLRVPGVRQKGTEKQEIGGGTGFIISEDGLILTNKHVVLDAEAEYTVLTNEGDKFTAKVLAKDPVQDIAVLKIEAGKKLPVVALGDSDGLEIGQSVIAIGNVLGEFRNSVSVGIVSGLGRSITASGDSGFSEALDDIIQTDAAINKGNSGGPLLNLKGEVSGINTAVELSAQSVGFAIPINKAKKDIVQVRESGKISYPFLGIYYTLITPALKKDFNLQVDYGAWIGHDQTGRETAEAVFTDSAAEKAGLKKDDIILEFGGEKVNLESPLVRLLAKYNPGDSVSLKVLRGTEEKILSITLGERSE